MNFKIAAALLASFISFNAIAAELGPMCTDRTRDDFEELAPETVALIEKIEAVMGSPLTESTWTTALNGDSSVETPDVGDFRLSFGHNGENGELIANVLQVDTKAMNQIGIDNGVAIATPQVDVLGVRAGGVVWTPLMYEQVRQMIGAGDAVQFQMTALCLRDDQNSVSFEMIGVPGSKAENSTASFIATRVNGVTHLTGQTQMVGENLTEEQKKPMVIDRDFYPETKIPNWLAELQAKEEASAAQ